MKNKAKRFISVLLVLVTVLGLFPTTLMTAYAAGGNAQNSINNVGGNMTWIWILLGSLAVLLIGGGIALAILKKKKPKNGGADSKHGSLWSRITHQFKKHPVRSVSITLPVVALITVGILFFCGVFNLNSAEQWSYLPNRAYILAPTEIAEPQTLDELLHSDAPSIESFLRTPAIAQKLLEAEEWTDIVDSRFALYNLRELDRQLEERLAESLEDISLTEFIRPEDGLLADTPLVSHLSAPTGKISVV